jgi:hypothetical protein
MIAGLRENLVKLVRKDSPQGTAVGLFSAFGWHPEELSLKVAADALAIDRGERQDHTVADGGPAERAGIGGVRVEANDVTSAFESDDRQLHREVAAPCGEQFAPCEAQAGGPHDGIDFGLERIGDRSRRGCWNCM